MSGEKYNPAVRLLVEQFQRAAVVTHYGDEDEDNAMQLAGIRSAKKAAQGLDAFGARLALVPLLEDPDWGIRAFAAGYLLRIAPERSLPVLKDVYEHGSYYARMTGGQLAAELRTWGVEIVRANRGRNAEDEKCPAERAISRFGL
ncbi:MAG: HEAT repeat domain-containing protein [Methylocystis sp.]